MPGQDLSTPFGSRPNLSQVTVARLAWKGQAGPDPDVNVFSLSFRYSSRKPKERGERFATVLLPWCLCTKGSEGRSPPLDPLTETPASGSTSPPTDASERQERRGEGKMTDPPIPHSLLPLESFFGAIPSACLHSVPYA